VLSRSFVALGLLALALVAGPDGLDAQSPRPLPPVRPAPGPPPPPANICTTQWGWCQLPTLSAPLGVACYCLTADNQEVPGITRYFPYQGYASPYLQPHTGPPSTIR